MSVGLTLGSQGIDVLELQILLTMHLRCPGPLDGIFGERTRRAAIQMLDKDGIVPSREVDRLRSSPRDGIEIARVHTAVSLTDLEYALDAAISQGDDDLSSEQCLFARSVALAQLTVEHGVLRGMTDKQASEHGILPHVLSPTREHVYNAIWTWNIGNRQVRGAHREGGAITARPLVPYTMIKASEGSTDPIELTSACYAYASLEEGTAAYVGYLREECPKSWSRFIAGEPAAAAHELKIGRWRYSGDEAAYAAIMVSRYAALTKDGET